MKHWKASKKKLEHLKPDANVGSIALLQDGKITFGNLKLHIEGRAVSNWEFPSEISRLFEMYQRRKPTIDWLSIHNAEIRMAGCEIALSSLR